MTTTTSTTTTTTTTTTAPTNNTVVQLPSSSVVTTTKKTNRKNSATATPTVVTDATRRMVCGGMAGMIAKTATNPLERIKMLSQTGEHGGSHTILGLYRDILRNEGIMGLWAGNGVNLLRVFPAKAVVFASNDMYRSFLYEWTATAPTSSLGPQQQHQPSHKLSASMSFLAGGMAGMTATAVTYPLDFARGRISGKLAGVGVLPMTAESSSSSAAAATALPRKPQKVYGGIVQTLVVTVKDEGLFAIYKGVTPTIMGAMPYEGIKFGTVGLLEKMFPPKDETDKSNRPLRKLVFGGIGGVMAGLITYPNDTVRRLLQLQGSRGTSARYAGYWDCVRQTYQKEGIARFYRGLTINIIRMAPNAAVQFGSYELLKNWSAGYF